MNSNTKLTDEQLRKIEENRRKALAKRAARLQNQQPPSSRSLTEVANRSAPSKQVNSIPNKPVSSITNSKYVQPSKKPTQSLDSSNPQTQNDSDMKEFLAKFTRPGSSQNTYKHKQSSGIARLFSSTNDATKRNNITKNNQHQALNTVQNPGSNKAELAKGMVSKTVKGICVLLSRKRFAVKVQFHGPLIGIFKTIASRSYDKETTTWSFGLEDYKDLISAAKVLQPSVHLEGLPRSVLLLFTKTQPGTLKDLPSQDINLNAVDSKLVSALMPFQKQGVSFCIRHNGRVLIADDMGLGKTLQAVCVVCYYCKEWPVLVVCPSSMRLSWQQAFIRWLPSVDPQSINVVFTGKDNPTFGLINIISYDLLPKFSEHLKSQQIRVIIADESHSIKSYKAARTKAALPLLKNATRVVLLSGTPALSRPMELYTQITAVKPKLFPTFHEFGVRYCGAVENRWGWDYSGCSNMEELQLILAECIMIRRMKKEVLNELPSKRRQMVLLDPSLIKTKPLEKAAKQVANAKQKDQHGALLNYFFESCSSKVAAVKEYILDLLEGGHKFLVFAHHKDMLDAVSDCITAKKYKSIRIDGQTPSSKRQTLCDRFQSQKDVVVAVLSITAANTGLTLTEGTAVVFAELFWNPGALVQAEDRVYRIGQRNSVNIHYLVAKGTADDYLWPLIQGKLEVLNKAGLSGDDFSDADMKTFQDPKQKTLFSCFESLIKENDDMNTSLSPPAISGPHISDVAKATGAETCDFDGSTVTDDIDWFVGMDNDDSIFASCMGDTSFKGGKMEQTSNKDSEPLAKRSKRH